MPTPLGYARRLRSRVADAPAVRAPRNRLERLRRSPWPAGLSGSPTGDRVAVVVVNYQTRELISHLIFSLYRILGADRFSCLVVVDNASTDGSAGTLAALRDAGLLHFIANRHQRYHGPALNQAMSWLASRQSRIPADDRVDYVWVLDSDTVVLRRDVLDGAVSVLRSAGAAIAGQKIPGVASELVPPSCMLLDPARAWRRGLPPFLDDGAPSHALQRALLESGERIVDFPFGLDTHVLHLGSGTLSAIADRGEDANRFYGWALQHREFSYSRHPLGRWLHARFRELYAAEVPDDRARTLVDACRRPDLLTIPEARPLPPLEELAELAQRGVDLERHLLERFDVGR